MKTFNLILDQKATIWDRSYIDVEAETLEEAIEKCKNEAFEVDDGELLYDTLTYLSPSKEHPCTTEIFLNNEYHSVYSNDIRSI